MNVAGPSRPRSSGQRGRVESTYEDDLLGLVSQLSVDDMDEMQTFFTRTGNSMSDHDIAMNDLLQQARALAALNQDRVLAQRIAAGDDLGVDQRPAQRAPALTWAVQRPNENGTATQRNGLGNQQRAGQAARNGAAPSQTWGGWLSSVVGWMFRVQPAPALAPTNARTAVPRAPTIKRPTGHNCVICQDPIHGAEIRASCGHYYDIECITDLFQSSTRDETLFPPRCCRQNIPFTQVRPHLSQALITTFQQKEVEFGTLKRVYCSSPTCSRFLGPLSEGIFTSKVYACPAPGCGRRTCGKCREQHSGDWTHSCRPDADAAQVLELGRASGWARCPGCSQMIELHIGCFHMTCRCRTEFCYLCRARWKTCQCPQWDERRLMAAAEARVDARLGDRDRGAQRAVPAPVPVPAYRVPVGTRPAVPVPAPVPAPRPAPVPVRLPAVEVVYPRPTPTRVPAASSATVRPTSVTSTSARVPKGETNQRVDSWRSSIATASRAPTNTGVSTSASASASTSTPGSRSGWRSTSTAASTPAPSFVRPKSIHETDPMRQRLVREMMERLREDHECTHTQWRYRNGGGICQNCGHHLPLYLFRCQGCEMLACRRCKCNRL